MMSPGELACLALNRVLPARRVEGRESPRAYAEAQYRWAEQTLTLHAPYVDLHGATLLDAGCGLGGKAVYFSERGCARVEGIDADPAYIAEAQAFAADRGAVNATFRTGQLDALPYTTDEFDIVMMNDVLEHVVRARLSDTLLECKRVLRPGGVLCIDFSPWTAHDAAHLYDYIRIPWCQVLFSDETLIRVTRRLNPRPTHGALTVVDHFQELNRLTFDEFRALVGRLGFTIVRLERKMVRRVRALRRVPVLRDYFMSRVLAVISK
jgi:2-polyprenyl-3-methyl-5-hydroxy-6-metoxy-1,4-benzoquinol methylase